MSYKGDLATRTGERFSDWAWSERLSPRWVLGMAVLWLVTVWSLGIFLILRDARIEPFLVIMLFAPGNLLGVAGLGRKHGDGPIDEWQEATRNKAFMWGGNLTLAVFATWAGLAMGFADNTLFWTPKSEDHWTIVFVLMVSTWMSLTTIVAAWLTPSYAADLDEYE